MKLVCKCGEEFVTTDRSKQLIVANDGVAIVMFECKACGGFAYAHYSPTWIQLRDKDGKEVG